MPQPGIYIHIPFCRSICPYCDFAVVRDSQRRVSFADRLIREAETVDWSGPTGFDTMYFGGGTPSLLAPEDLERIVSAVTHRFDVDRPAIYLEANPEDVDTGRAAAWRKLGVCFLSLGVQALEENRLRFLGRDHGVHTATEAVTTALEAGFDTVSVDLIYGHAGQDLASWTSELERVAALGVGHLSCYSLTVEAATPFGKRELAGEQLLPPQSRQADFFLTTHRTLEALGYAAYEVSNFARDRSRRSRHNRKYWTSSPYLGLGPSAHSFDGWCRWWNLRSESAWARKVDAGQTAIASREILTLEQRALEDLALGLRTEDGVDLERFKIQYDWDLWTSSRVYMADLEARGLARIGGSRLQLTLDGWLVADGIAAGF